MDSDQEARLVKAVEQIGDSLARLATVHETRLAHDHPIPKEVRDVSISRIPTDDDTAKEVIGGDQDQPLARWLTDVSDGDSTALGPRERAFQEADDNEEGS